MGLKYQGIHRHQLFHWIGRHIDYKKPDDDDSRITALTDDQRETYLSSLRGVLDPRMGLWMKTPRAPDQIDDGRLVRIRQPILCFSEWSLADSLPHSYKYGRLGLGFPRKFLLGMGGQPISYIDAAKAQQDYFAAALLAIARHFRTYKGRDAVRLKPEFLYLTQFIKKLRMDRRDKELRDIARSVKRFGKRVPSRAAPTKTYAKQYGPYLEFLEEREWRVVFHPDLERRGKVRKNTECPKSGPEYYVPVRPGRDLFTVVLPDYRTAHILHGSATFADVLSQLNPPDEPHVTLLTLDDIGTF
jgi:hypothetical protein